MFKNLVKKVKIQIKIKEGIQEVAEEETFTMRLDLW